MFMIQDEDYEHLGTFATFAHHKPRTLLLLVLLTLIHYQSVFMEPPCTPRSMTEQEDHGWMPKSSAPKPGWRASSPGKHHSSHPPASHIVIHMLRDTTGVWGLPAMQAKYTRAKFGSYQINWALVTTNTKQRQLMENLLHLFSRYLLPPVNSLCPCSSLPMPHQNPQTTLH